MYGKKLLKFDKSDFLKQRCTSSCLLRRHLRLLGFGWQMGLNAWIEHDRTSFLDKGCRRTEHEGFTTLFLLIPPEDQRFCFYYYHLLPPSRTKSTPKGLKCKVSLEVPCPSFRQLWFSFGVFFPCRDVLQRHPACSKAQHVQNISECNMQRQRADCQPPIFVRPKSNWSSCPCERNFCGNQKYINVIAYWKVDTLLYKV